MEYPVVHSITFVGVKTEHETADIQLPGSEEIKKESIDTTPTTSTFEIKLEPDVNINEEDQLENLEVKYRSPKNTARKRNADSEEKLFKCEFCPRTYNKKYRLREHVKTHSDDKPYKCGECPQAYSCIKYLTRHLKGHTKPYRCDICSKTFAEKSYLLKHSKAHNGEIVKPYLCADSVLQGSEEINKESIDTSTAQVTFELKLEPDVNIVEEDQLENLEVKYRSPKKTVRKRNADSEEKLFKCEFCPRTYNKRHRLREHVKTHSDDKPFKCGECPKAYRCIAYLTRHLKSHTKPYRCDICLKNFADKSYLLRHFKAHNGEKMPVRKKRLHRVREKRFQCDVCNKFKFSNKTDLRRHLQSHSGEKPFQCEECHQRFSKKYDVSVHMRIHTGEKPFRCELCQGTFAHKSTYVKHVRTHTRAKAS